MSALLLAVAMAAATSEAVPPMTPPAAITPPGPSAEPETAYLDLAEELSRLGEFDQCSIEALRHAYVHPEGRVVGFERAAHCLDLAHRYLDARRLILELGPPSTLPPRARWRLCYSDVFLRDTEGLPGCQTEGTDRYDRLAAYASVMRSVVAGEWAHARKELAAQRAPGPTDWALQDDDFIKRHEQLPYKSPWLAAALSTVLPGAGRAYIGRWGDGAFSLLLVGVPAGFAAHDFYAHGIGSGAGWLLSSLAGLFYLGDIYGSAVGAVVENHHAAEALAHDVESAYAGRSDP
ncbi:MAG: hypothetical protein ACYCWW_18760 [Deltaproteobacteria bacterium]